MCSMELLVSCGTSGGTTTLCSVYVGLWLWLWSAPEPDMHLRHGHPRSVFSLSVHPSRLSPLFSSLFVHPSRLSQILNSKLLLLCWFLLELVPCRSNSQRVPHPYPSTTSRFDCDTRRCERALLKFPSIHPRILGILLSGRTCPHPS